MMPMPAVPKYMDDHILHDGKKTFQSDMPPGHRFGMFFPLWDQPWKIPDAKKGESPKKAALGKVISYGETASKLLDMVLSRQAAAAKLLRNNVLLLVAESTAPFMTGMGMDHPVENGFSFLFPYGLPYFSGSGVKGIIRKSAEELALGLWDDPKGWDLLSLWYLFGYDANCAFLGNVTTYPEPLDQVAQEMKKAYHERIEELDKARLQEFLANLLSPADRQKWRKNPIEFFVQITKDKRLRNSVSFKGALEFWDVFPETVDQKLGIDILNPHHSDYYQNNDGRHPTPSTCESPTPIFFLTIPPGSKFAFYVRSHSNRLETTFYNQWKELVIGAFQHTVDWSGFGSKTSVGYGNMRLMSGKDAPSDNSTPDASHAVDPEKARKDRLESFSRSLPDRKDFPGKAAAIVNQIEAIEDFELKKECLLAAAEVIRGANSFKKAIKNKKRWATSFSGLCDSIGVKIT